MYVGGSSHRRIEGCANGVKVSGAKTRFGPPFKKNIFLLKKTRKSFLERYKIKWPKSDEKTEFGWR